MTKSKLFHSWVKAETFVKSNGCRRGDPLTQSLQEARKNQMEYLLFLANEEVELGQKYDHQIDGPYGPLKLRILMPKVMRFSTPIIYIRGGGWWVGNLETSARTMALLCNASGMPVIGIDYRLSPEHCFPVQQDEVVFAGMWLAKHGHSFGLAMEFGIVMWGESAGATLAVCASRELLSLGVKSIGHLLNYGNFLGPHELLRPVSRWVWQQYLKDQLEKPPNRALVFVKNGLAGIQRAWVSCGTNDDLLIDTRALVQKLKSEGIPHVTHFPLAMPHGYIAMSRFLEPAQKTIEAAAGYANAFVIEARTQSKLSLGSVL